MATIAGKTPVGCSQTERVCQLKRPLEAARHMPLRLVAPTSSRRAVSRDTRVGRCGQTLRPVLAHARIYARITAQMVSRKCVTNGRTFMRQMHKVTCRTSLRRGASSRPSSRAGSAREPRSGLGGPIASSGGGSRKRVRVRVPPSAQSVSTSYHRHRAEARCHERVDLYRHGRARRRRNVLPRDDARR